jgi:uncharacterized protein (DUF2267 family)
MAKTKNKVGRPKDTLETLPELWYNEILDLYKEGGSDEEAKALLWNMRNKNGLKFSNNLFERWIEEEEEFWETIHAGRMLAASWWHKNGRENLGERNFNYQGWFMQMKNRFGWADKSDINQRTVQITSAPMSKEEIQDISKGLDEEY